MNQSNSVQEYLQSASPDARNKLTQIRELVKSLAPDATEKIAYGIPTFVLNGNLIHYGAFKNHISLFPGGGAVTNHFAAELAGYKTAKGTVQFPLDQPLPLDLIEKIIVFRVEQNRSKA